MPKMHQNTFGGRAPSGPAGELKRSPDPLTLIKGVLLLRGWRGGNGGERNREGEMREREGKGEERKGKGKGCAPNVESWIRQCRYSPVTLPKLEIRSVERGICPIATSTMN